MKIFLFLIVIFASFASAQGLDSEPLERGFSDEDAEWVEQLASPVAVERALAILECEKRGLFNETLIERLWKDWKHVLSGVLSVTWPSAADSLINRLYEHTGEYNEYINIWGYVLFKHKKFDHIDADLPVAAEVRKLFYDDYKSRASHSYVYGDKYRYIASKPWLYQMFIQDKDVSFSGECDKHIAHWFADKSDIIPLNSWVKELDVIFVAVTCPKPIDKWVYTSELGRVNATVLACLILDRKEWAYSINEVCVEWAIEIETDAGIETQIYDFHSEIVRLMTMPDTTKAMLAIKLYDTQISPWQYPSRFNKFLLLHHPCCKAIREAHNFKSWIEDLDHRITVIDPDPAFEHARYGY